MSQDKEDMVKRGHNIFENNFFASRMQVSYLSYSNEMSSQSISQVLTSSEQGRLVRRIT